MNLKQSVLATLIYHDIFDYPLTLEEIYKYLIQKKSSFDNVKLKTNQLHAQKIIGSQFGYYFLKNRLNFVKMRSQRESYSKNKFKKAHFYANVLKIIPSIKLVAISGALSMFNSTKNDDIDFVIITSKNTLWVTRLLANLVLFPYKRSPKSKLQNNKACLNLFLDESSVKIQEQNLYTAHELCQMKLLWDRDKTYSKLIKSNKWIYKYLPNWKPEIDKRKNKISGNISFLTTHLTFFEVIARYIQIKYMRRKVTNEKIGDKQLFFHPLDTRDYVLTKYKSRLKKVAKI